MQKNPIYDDLKESIQSAIGKSALGYVMDGFSPDASTVLVEYIQKTFVPGIMSDDPMDGIVTKEDFVGKYLPYILRNTNAYDNMSCAYIAEHYQADDSIVYELQHTYGYAPEVMNVVDGLLQHVITEHNSVTLITATGCVFALPNWDSLQAVVESYNSN